MENLSLYLHIPFCQRKCLFCSFVIVVGQEKRSTHYLNALFNEMYSYGKHKLATIYLGGGTPTMLSAEQLERLFTKIFDYYDCSSVQEITVEANPEGLTNDKLDVLKRMGVTRLSIGVQSMNDHYLKYLGRCHDVALARDALARAKEYGFENINLDLMYSFPNQTRAELISDVDGIASLDSHHLSLYALTIEEKSKFGAQDVQLDDPEKLAEDYEFIVERLAHHGFKQYEVSNFSKDGFQSKHNQRYWTGEPYLGLGMGAHSFYHGKRYWNISTLQDYLQKLDKGESVIDDQETLTAQQHLNELLIFGLRMNGGVSIGELEQKSGTTLKPHQLDAIGHLIDNDMLRQENERLYVTNSGRVMLDEIAVNLIDIN